MSKLIPTFYLFLLRRFSLIIHDLPGRQDVSLFSLETLQQGTFNPILVLVLASKIYDKRRQNKSMYFSHFITFSRRIFQYMVLFGLFFTFLFPFLPIFNAIFHYWVTNLYTSSIRLKNRNFSRNDQVTIYLKFK